TLGREVALKVLHAGALATPKAIERFAREAKAAAQLRHPHIVPIYEPGIDGPQPYLASAYIAGRTVAVLIEEANEQGTPVDPRRAALLVRDLADALHYAHSQGIIHRDVKPANIMVDHEGQVHASGTAPWWGHLSFRRSPCCRWSCSPRSIPAARRAWPPFE